MKSFLPSLWDEKDDPFSALQKQVDRVFSDYTRSMPASGELFGKGVPALEISESADGMEIAAELPGVDEKDIEITLSDRSFVLRGEKKAEETRTENEVHVTERSYGSFRRQIALPWAPDPALVQASFDKGVLKVHLPKPEQERERTSRIEIGKKH